MEEIFVVHYVSDLNVVWRFVAGGCTSVRLVLVSFWFSFWFGLFDSLHDGGAGLELSSQYS